MKILALGATGVIGQQLSATLVSEGHEVYVTSRSSRSSKPPLHYIKGNAKDPAFLTDVLAPSWDVIIDFMVYDTQSFENRVMDLLGATSQYIFISSARVFADTKGLLTERSPRLLNVSEDAAFQASDEYAIGKARQEDLLRASGLSNWTIIRPYITFGKERLQLGTLEKEAWLYRAQRGRKIVFCRDMLPKATTMTDGDHVAMMIKALVGNSAALGEDFNLTGRESVTWHDVLTLYQDVLQEASGTRPPTALMDIGDFCKSAASVPQVRYDRMFNRRFDPSKIGAFYNLDQIPAVLPNLKSRLEHQLEYGGFFALEGRGEALRDKAASQYTPLSAFGDGKQKIRYLAYRFISESLLKHVRSRP